MKNKISLITLTFGTFLAFNAIASAQDNSGASNTMPKENDGKKFAEHKAEMLAHINKEKSIIDQMASCVNVAQKIEDIKKCHDNKKTEMQKLQAEVQQKRQQRMGERKQRLTDELKKIESKMESKESVSDKK